MSVKNSRLPGEMFMMLALVALAGYLAFNFNTQIRWFDNLPWFNQPGFWPLVAVCGMAITGPIMAFQLFFMKPNSASTNEYAMWVRASEYAVWFMGYVVIVPYLGYLPTSILFTTLLGRRIGYRKASSLVSCGLFGLVVVLIFKTLLHVNVPGGAVYELLPSPFKSIMLTYF